MATLRREQVRESSARGQAVTEFILTLTWMVLVVLVLFQVTLVAIEKFRFNRDAFYVARAWSVRHDLGSPDDALDKLHEHMALRWTALTFKGENVPSSEEWRWACMSVAERNASESDGPVEMQFDEASDAYSGSYDGLVFKYHIPVILPGARTILADQQPDRGLPTHLETWLLHGHLPPVFSRVVPGGRRTWASVLGTSQSVQAVTFIPMKRFSPQTPGPLFDNDR